MFNWRIRSCRFSSVYCDMRVVVLLWVARAWTPPTMVHRQKVAWRATTRELDASRMSEVMVREHEKTLEMLAAARGDVVAEYAPRIAALEAAIKEANQRSVGAPSQELHFLEYGEVPVNVISKKAPLEAKVVSVERAIGNDAPGEICHIVMDTGGKLPYIEGQSIGVLPPGLDDKGRPHQQRLYSIASTRYGDDKTGTSVSLCVRRAVFVDPETKEEDPSKKGVCSNFLCDSTSGSTVQITGPVGKTMLLPDNDDFADIIMVATGTGVAPFRGFVERLFVERTPAAASYEGRASLFLGVPTTSSLLYPDLFEAAADRHSNFDLTYAISREQPNPQTGDGKCYVQHRLQEHADDIFKRLENGAHIYFCGLKGMMPGIEDALATACEQRSLDFSTWLKHLKKEKRWHVEVY